MVMGGGDGVGACCGCVFHWHRVARGWDVDVRQHTSRRRVQISRCWWRPRSNRVVGCRWYSVKGEGCDGETGPGRRRPAYRRMECEQRGPESQHEEHRAASQSHSRVGASADGEGSGGSGAWTQTRMDADADADGAVRKVHVDAPEQGTALHPNGLTGRSLSWVACAQGKGETSRRPPRVCPAGCNAPKGGIASGRH